MPSKLKDVISFRGNKVHAMMFKAAPYKRFKSLLLRLLLDAYFNNELPQIKAKFEKEIYAQSQSIRTPPQP